jgi:hypothetical protein
MDKKALIIAIFLIVILTVGVGFWRWENSKKAEIERQAVLEQQKQEEEARRQNIDKQNQKDAEIESIKDLVDGEYDFGNIDTSDWQIYRNEKIGFEVKIPKNWLGEEKNLGVCLGERGKVYIVENSAPEDSCGIYIGADKETNILKNGKFREVISRRKTGYNSKIYHTIIDGYDTIVQNGFGIETYIFRNEKYRVISNSVISSKLVQAYPGILKTFKFIDK